MSHDDKDRQAAGNPAAANENEGKISAADRQMLRERAASIGAKIETAQVKSQPQRAANAGVSQDQGAAMGQASKITAELVVGVAAGGIIGFALDRGLNWTPWGLIIGLVLGFAAGMVNVIRTARQMQKAAEPLQAQGRAVRETDEDET